MELESQLSAYAKRESAKELQKEQSAHIRQLAKEVAGIEALPAAEAARFALDYGYNREHGLLRAHLALLALTNGLVPDSS